MLDRTVRRLVLAMLLVSIGCSAQTQYKKPLPRQHMLQFNRDGLPVDVAATSDGADRPAAFTATPDQPAQEQVPAFRDMADPLTEAQYEAYIEIVLDGIEGYAESCGVGEPCRLSFFIHGGLNDNRTSVRRVLRSLCDNYARLERELCDLEGPMLADGERYPIFVLWSSSLTSSYFAHLLRIQRGREVGPVGWLGAPWKLVADTGRAVSRAPIVWYEMASHDFRTVPGQRLKRTVDQDAERYYQALEAAYLDDPDDNSPVRRCRSRTANPERVANAFAYWLGLPFKFALSPFIDAFGTVSWDVMLRRTDLLFEQELFCADDPEDENCPYRLVPEPPLTRVRSGGLGRFLDHLQHEIEPGGRLHGPRWEITLIGHSMGGIVVNRILNRFPELPVERVVYMASASTVRDYEESALPLLVRRPTAEVYHLVLHPFAELRERAKVTDLGVADLAPRGSLLVWIDNFLSKPNTLEDRTAGRFVNITRALAATPLDLKPRVHLTAFGVGAAVGDAQPQKHGHFSDPAREFWSEAFWEPEFEGAEGCL